MSQGASIRRLSAAQARERVVELAGIMRDAVAGGASINFLEDVTDEVLTDYWLDSASEQELGHRQLFVAEVGGVIVGTAMVMFAQMQNQPHRGDVGKVLVHSSYRRRGIAVQLMSAIEQAALDNGRTLLMLDTEKGSDGELLYVANGWVKYGEVPGHALKPDGVPKPTSFFYKVLEG
jgi:GNAT superfamily N-acetyltransferase